MTAPPFHKTQDPARLVAVDDIVCLAEAAQRLGEPLTRLNRWRERRALTGFPTPLKRTGRMLLYSLADIRTWRDGWKATRKGYYPP
jgi:hypothetical protein